MEIKKWFEDGTGLKIRERRVLQKPPLPYSVFFDDMSYRGADQKNNINEHNITIEHYHDGEKQNHEKIIESFLILEKEKGRFDNFTKNREYLHNESLWVTVFELSPFLVKTRKEK